MAEKFDSNQKEGRLKKILLPIILTVAIIAAYVGGFFTSSCTTPKVVDKTEEVAWLIHEHAYIYDETTGEFKKYGEKDYADALVSGLLDEYSAYYTKEEYEEVIKEGAGRKNGVGLTFYGDSTSIFSVIGNSPADVVGIRAGDVLVKGKVGDGEEKTFSDIDDIMEFFSSAKANSEFSFTVNRAGREINFNLTATDYKRSYVTYYDSENKLVFRTENRILDKKIEDIPSDDNMKGVLSSDTA